MYRNNKANLWLRTICITVALLGMLFFTHSQFSSALAPEAIHVTISTTTTGTLDVGDTINFEILVFPDGTHTITDATLTYTIGSAIKTAAITFSALTSQGRFDSTESYTIAEGDNGAVGFTKINLATSDQAAADYTTTATASTKAVVLTIPSPAIMVAGVVEPVADVDSVAVGITSSGDDTDVTIGETVNVDVIVMDNTEGVHQATGNTLQYKIAGGSPMDITLARGDNATHLTGMLEAVASGDTAGAFTFHSVKLILQNADGDAATPVEKTYTTESTSAVVVALTDAGLTIKPVYPVEDPTSIDLNITAAKTTLGINDSVTFAVNITDSTDGNAAKVTVNYQINGTAYKGSIDLDKQENEKGLWNASLTITENTTSGNLTFVSLVVNLTSRDSSATAVKTYDATAAMITGKLNIAIDVPAPVDPPAANKTTSNTAATTASANASATSSVTISDSPVSIFAVFILIASVSMAVGVYTLRRRQ